MTTSLFKALDTVSSQVNEKMDDLLPKEVEGRIGENRLARAMRYSVLSDGKRLRPFLVLNSSNLFGVSLSSSLQAAAALEFMHVYSLIHNDLPAMDDDDFRRGVPSCHKQFDEATAILAGDALLTFSFEVLSHESTHEDSRVRANLVQAFAVAGGTKGMIGGQMIDMLSEDRQLTAQEITRLQRMKTGALFVLACEAGAILGKAPLKLTNALKAYAHDMGLAFQITDDILDAEDTEGSRKESTEKGTYVHIMGVDKAKQQAKILTDQAVTHLDVFDAKADNLRELARYIVNRDK